MFSCLRWVCRCLTIGKCLPILIKAINGFLLAHCLRKISYRNTIFCLGHKMILEGGGMAGAITYHALLLICIVLWTLAIRKATGSEPLPGCCTHNFRCFYPPLQYKLIILKKTCRNRNWPVHSIYSKRCP